MEKEIMRQAKGLQKELVRYRRYLHERAETGFDLEKTLPFVEKSLREMGYSSQKCGRAGLTATVGKRGAKTKTFLLRADMDGLPLREETGLSFACKSGNMHACGHDLHTAMLLGAARLLKMLESELNGCVRLLFQPAEETLEGARDVLKTGVLQTPKPQGAMMLHVMTGSELPTGTAVIASGGVSAPAADFFRIGIQGKGCHGSMPQKGVDALTVAAHTVIALQEISAREISASEPHVLTVGALKAGEAENVIADFAELKGTLRTFDESVRSQIKKRLTEISRGIAKAFRATAEVEFTSGCPTLVNDGALSEFAVNAVRALLGEKNAFPSSAFGGAKSLAGGSEDFAYISHKIPSVMIALGAGSRADGYEYSLHHPKARFDEGALYVGSAIYAHVAVEWLRKNGK